jgi:hypothetical protein
MMQLTPSAKETISSYVGNDAAFFISSLVEETGVRLIIKRERTTKSGDYSHPHPKRPFHQITVNGSLNRYAFFITFIHEIAHLRTWNLYKNKVLPHGKEWKNQYFLLLKEINCPLYFPEDIRVALDYHIQHIKSSSAYDIRLMKALKKYDANPEILITVGDLVPDSQFEYRGRHFVRGEKLRTRIKCKCISDKRIYLFHQMAPIEPINTKQEYCQ